MTEAPSSRPVPVPWEEILAKGWRKVAALALAALGAASFIWQLGHQSLLFGLLLAARDGNVREQQIADRRELFQLSVALLVPAALLALRELWRIRNGRVPAKVHVELLLFSLAVLPPLRLPTFEVQHPYLTALFVVWFSGAFAFAMSRLLPRFQRKWHEPSTKACWWMVGAAWLSFVAVMGFLSHWRYITFHAQPCDLSFEVNAVWGIVHHGLPMNSVGAFMYGDKPLPQPYLNNHTPYIYYLFAPFYALFEDARTLLWLQAMAMGAGAFGVYLFARQWLASGLLGVLAAWLYVLHPNIQSYCLHDLHANTLAIPTLLLALGLMEQGRHRWAMLFGVLTMLCREETPLYSAGLSLFWVLGSTDRARIRWGLLLLASSALWLVVNSRYIMPAFGGQPRWEHFSLFFDSPDSLASAGKALVLNPSGALYGFANDLSITYLVYCLVPAGFLALWGLRAAWLILPAAGLMLTSGSPGFYCPGMNYSAPLVPAAIVMGIGGWRWWLQRPARGGTSVATGGNQASGVARSIGVTAYVLAAGVLCSYLYGNFLSKGYHLEYGYSPLRRQNDYSRADMSGWVTELPPFGRQERAVWAALSHVPKHASVASSWTVTPQLSDRGVSLTLNYSTPQAADRVDIIVIDKLPMMQVRTEPLLAALRQDERFRLRFENEGAAVFERRKPLSKL